MEKPVTELPRAHPMLICSLVLFGCAPAPRDPADQALALLKKRLGNEAVIKSMVVDADLVCGYATPSTGVFPWPIPFMARKRDLLLLSDDPQQFERAERACGAGWVAPNTNMRPVS
jgi:hypothetical protein